MSASVEQLIEEALVLSASATGGPWYVVKDAKDNPCVVIFEDEDERVRIGSKLSDAEFIARARTLLPELARAAMKLVR